MKEETNVTITPVEIKRAKDKTFLAIWITAGLAALLILIVFVIVFLNQK